MKILAIGDPHGKLPKNLDAIVRREKPEVIACVGDIPPVPKLFRSGRIKEFPPEFLKKADKSLKDIVKKLCSYKLPVLVLRGNMYLTGSRNRLTKEIFSKYSNLHHKRTGFVKVNGRRFFLFDMSFEQHMYEKKYSRMNRWYKPNVSRRKRLFDFLKKNRDAIVISHAPPFKILDKTYNGLNRGSKILRDAIEKYQPPLVLCGHIHEAKGRKKLGKTRVINLGFYGDYEVVEV